MNVGELKLLLEGIDDSVLVIVPLNAGEGFDGMFFSPCIEDSGLGKMGAEDLDEEDIEEMKLLNKEIPEVDEFLLVPCGFFEPKEHNHELN
jgi:hypothetical protein